MLNSIMEKVANAYMECKFGQSYWNFEGNDLGLEVWFHNKVSAMNWANMFMHNVAAIIVVISIIALVALVISCLKDRG